MRPRSPTRKCARLTRCEPRSASAPGPASLRSQRQLNGGRVGQVVLEVAPAETDQLAELAGRDHLARRLQDRVAGEIEADQVRDPGAFGGGGHFGRLRAQRQRLLAVDVLARGEGREHHLAVQVIRRADVDDVDRRVGDERPPVARAAPEAQRAPRRGGARFVAVGDELEHRRRDVLEHSADRASAMACERPMKPVPMSPILSEVMCLPVHRTVTGWPLSCERCAASASASARSPSRPVASCTVSPARPRGNPRARAGTHRHSARGRTAARARCEAGAIRALDPRRRGVVGTQHAERAEGLDALVVAERAATAVRDLADAAAGRGQQRDRGIDIARRADCGVDEARAARIDLHRLFAEQPTRHVEVVNHHVAKQSARATDVVDRRRRRVAAGDRERRERADRACSDLRRIRAKTDRSGG